MSSSAAFVEAEALAGRSWLAWLLTPRIIFGARHSWIVLPYGGGRAIKLPLRERHARLAVAAVKVLLALAFAALVALAVRALFRSSCGGARRAAATAARASAAVPAATAAAAAAKSAEHSEAAASEKTGAPRDGGAAPPELPVGLPSNEAPAAVTRAPAERRAARQRLK